RFSRDWSQTCALPISASTRIPKATSRRSAGKCESGAGDVSGVAAPRGVVRLQVLDTRVGQQAPDRGFALAAINQFGIDHQVRARSEERRVGIAAACRE